MTGSLIDGKAIAEKVKAEVAVRAAAFLATHGRKPGLEVILVGDDPASHVYVKNKEASAGKAGLHGAVHRMPADTSQAALLEKVRELNAADHVDVDRRPQRCAVDAHRHRHAAVRGRRHVRCRRPQLHRQLHVARDRQRHDHR